MSDEPEPEPTSGRARGLHRSSTLVLSAAMLVLGLAILVRTLSAGGGPLAIGTVLGLLFVAAGAGRLYFTWRDL